MAEKNYCPLQALKRAFLPKGYGSFAERTTQKSRKVTADERKGLLRKEENLYLYSLNNGRKLQTGMPPKCNEKIRPSPQNGRKQEIASALPVARNRIELKNYIYNILLRNTEQTMNKKTKWGIIGIIGAGIIGGGIYSQLPKMNQELMAAEEEIGNRQQKEKKALNVNAQIIKPHLLTDEFTVTGSIKPDEEANLSFETSGKVTEILFEEGSFVKRGELLAKVNDRQLQAQLKKLQAQVKLAQARVYRQEKLLEKDAVSKESLEEVQTDLDILNAEIETVKAQIELTELRAPFDGIIGLRQISLGTYASPTTVVAKLTKMAPLKIEFNVPERYADEMKKGVNIRFSITGTGDREVYDAQIYAVEGGINSEDANYTVTARALYPNRHHEIIPGGYASVLIKKKELHDAIAIPTEAISPEMGKDMVYLYKEGKAEPMEVITGEIRTEAEVQIVKGLQLGDTIIISGIMQLRKGLPVTLDNID